MTTTPQPSPQNEPVTDRTVSTIKEAWLLELSSIGNPPMERCPLWLRYIGVLLHRIEGDGERITELDQDRAKLDWLDAEAIPMSRVLSHKGPIVLSWPGNSPLRKQIDAAMKSAPSSASDGRKET